MFQRVAVVVVLLGLLVAGVGFTSAVASANELPLIVVDNIVTGSKNAAEGESCIQQSRFARDKQVVWQIKVVDPTTAEEMTPAEISRIWVELIDGQTFEAKHGPRPKENPTDEFWTAAWHIPKDYPTGVMDYTIYADAVDGRTGQNVKFLLEVSMLTIIPD